MRTAKPLGLRFNRQLGALLSGAASGTAWAWGRCGAGWLAALACTAGGIFRCGATTGWLMFAATVAAPGQHRAERIASEEAMEQAVLAWALWISSGAEFKAGICCSPL